MTSSTFFVLQELNAVHHFVETLQIRGKPVNVQDAHHLLQNNLPVRNFLHSHWKLNSFQNFFRKYKRYFYVNSLGRVYLRNKGLNVEELNCVSIFLKLFMERQNYPIFITNAINFISKTDVEQFSKTSYDVKNLYAFFTNHDDFFIIDYGFVSLKHYRPQVSVDKGENVETRADSPLAESTPTKTGIAFPISTFSSNQIYEESDEEEMSTAARRKKKKFNRKMEKKAVDFYKRLLGEQEEIKVEQTLSFIQNDEELCEYFRNNYQSDNLELFFERHPDTFTVEGENVCLADANASAESAPCYISKKAQERVPDALSRQMKKKYMDTMNFRAVAFYLELLEERKEISMCQAQSFIQSDIELLDFLNNEYQLSDLEPFFEKYPDLFSFAGKSVRLASSSTRINGDIRNNYKQYTQNIPVKVETESPVPQNTPVMAKPDNPLSHTKPATVNVMVTNDNPETSNQPNTPAKAQVEEAAAEKEAMNRTQKRHFKRRMDHRAVGFYKTVLEKREEINVKQAHSFIQGDNELRDYLRNTYMLNNLGVFFEKHPELFSVEGEFVRLLPASTNTESYSPVPEDIIVKAATYTPTPQDFPVKTLLRSSTPQDIPVKIKSCSPVPQTIPVKTLPCSPVTQTTPVKTVSQAPIFQTSPVKTLPCGPVPQAVPAKTLPCSPTAQPIPVRVKKKAVPCSPTPQATPQKAIPCSPTTLATPMKATPLKHVPCSQTPQVTPMKAIPSSPTTQATPVKATPLKHVPCSQTPQITPMKAIPSSPTTQATPVKAEASSQSNQAFLVKTRLESSTVHSIPAMTLHCSPKTLHFSPTPQATPVKSESLVSTCKLLPNQLETNSEGPTLQRKLDNSTPSVNGSLCLVNDTPAVLPKQDGDSWIFKTSTWLKFLKYVQLSAVNATDRAFLDRITDVTSSRKLQDSSCQTTPVSTRTTGTTAIDVVPDLRSPRKFQDAACQTSFDTSIMNAELKDTFCQTCTDTTENSCQTVSTGPVLTMNVMLN